MSTKTGEKVVSVTMKTEDKQEFKKVCESMGLTTSAALYTFCKKVIRERRIPFDLVEK